MSDEHSIPDPARSELADELRSIRATGEDEWTADAGTTADPGTTADGADPARDSDD
jgi:hypothetical protein